MLTSQALQTSKCEDTRIPKFVQVADLVRVTDLLDNNNTKIEYAVGDFTLTWSDKHPELVRLHYKASVDNDTWIMRSQLAYVLERHRGAVRSRKDLNNFREADTWDMSRLSMGKEICATLKTRGFFAPSDPGSSDVIAAVGQALSNIREPLLEFKHQRLLAMASIAENERTNTIDDSLVTTIELLSSYRTLIDTCHRQISMFGRASVETGNELLKSFEETTKVISAMLDASNVTMSEARLRRSKFIGNIPKPPELEKDVLDMNSASTIANAVTIAGESCLSPSKTGTPDGWLARPSSNNVEACALYDRIVEALLAGKSINVLDATGGVESVDISGCTDLYIGEDKAPASVVVVDTDDLNDDDV